MRRARKSRSLTVQIYFLPSARSSAHATTRGGGPDPLFGFIALLGSSSFPLDDFPDDEMIFSAALTILEVDLK